MIMLWFGKKSTAKVRVNLAKRFELMDIAGVGSMSSLYRARDNELRQIVCLKILNKEKLHRFESRFKGLNRPSEGAVLMDLHHPHIVTGLEYGVGSQGEQFIIMQWIEGVGLTHLIATRSPQLDGKRIGLLIQLTSALEYIHQRGYLHRDICPRNVLVTDGMAMLIDFGVSVPNRPEFCKSGNRIGPIKYIAPEVIKRLPTDHRVDLYALGVTAYEVMTGDSPWPKANTLADGMSWINKPGRDPRELAPDLDMGTANFLMKAIHVDPGDRFQSAAEMTKALEALPTP
jgi:serine/threonine protein kinase